MCRWWVCISESSDDVRPLKKKMKKRSSSLLKILDFKFENWVLERRTIKRDLVQGFCFEASAQENLDKTLWALKTTPRLYPCEKCCQTRILRVWGRILQMLLARSFRAYTQSLRVTFGPTASFGLRGTNTPPYPFSHSLLPLWRAELKHKPRKSSLTPSPSFLSDSFEGFKWECSKSKNSC